MGKAEVVTANVAVSGGRMAAAVVASCLGWSLDLFDLFILFYAAPVVGHMFFPSDSSMLSRLSPSMPAFAVTMVMRPVGAAVFGRYADLRGPLASIVGRAWRGVRLINLLITLPLRDSRADMYAC
jgi:MFS transporter, MHS family, proline/betaine transporter